MAGAFSYIKDNVERVLSLCAERAERLGVPLPTLLAVTKSATDEEVRALVSQYGQSRIAENRTDMFLRRQALFEEGDAPEMHLIGHLQTNKVKYIIGKTAYIHSLDSRRLAEEIERQAEKHGVERVRVLLEVNSGREEAKGGVLPEAALGFAEEILAFPRLSLCGVMTMAPICESEAAYRPYFRETAAIFRALQDRGLLGKDAILSMGMSHSFTAAMEEGATMIRVGRSLFEKPSEVLA
ncbi:MAG: YggS family pyridoxal phosphate-dependent enzyme [Clostridia bacterium]|nr:YggS family pyridoxal phosphate-dependent enzyme [Clostridia bacterium]